MYLSNNLCNCNFTETLIILHLISFLPPVDPHHFMFKTTKSILTTYSTRNYSFQQQAIIRRMKLQQHSLSISLQRISIIYFYAIGGIC